MVESVHQFRFVAGCLALAAFTLTMAESVQASVCSPPEQPAAPPASADDCMNHADASSDDNPESKRPSETHCPFTAFAAGGSCVSATTVPPAISLQSDPPLELIVAASVPSSAFQPLLAFTLFHPPKV
jgi:hypothetical protein